MTLDKAKAQAKRSAKLTGECYYVLGPCPTDGYWAIMARTRLELYPDRAPVFTAAPDGRTSTP
jgi:hypothetical protein